LPAEIAAFQTNPHLAVRPIPAGLVADPAMMLAMDQFKDMRGTCRYAARLPVGALGAVTAWLAVAFDETLGGLLGIRLGPRAVVAACCDPDLVRRHLGADAALQAPPDEV